MDLHWAAAKSSPVPVDTPDSSNAFSAAGPWVLNPVAAAARADAWPPMARPKTASARTAKASVRRRLYAIGALRVIAITADPLLRPLLPGTQRHRHKRQ